MSVGEDPHDVAETLNREMRKKLRLRCGLKSGSPPNILSHDYIATTLLLVIKSDSAGRWRAEIIPRSQPVGFAHSWDSYIFEFETAGVVALLPRQRPRQRPGVRPRGNWPEQLTQWMRRIGLSRLQQMQNSGELRDEALDFLREKVHFEPRDPRDVYELILAFLAGEIQ